MITYFVHKYIVCSSVAPPARIPYTFLDRIEILVPCFLSISTLDSFWPINFSTSRDILHTHSLLYSVQRQQSLTALQSHGHDADGREVVDLSSRGAKARAVTHGPRREGSWTRYGKQLRTRRAP